MNGARRPAARRRLRLLAVLAGLLWLGGAASAPLSLSPAMNDVHLWSAMEILEAPAPALLADPSAHAFRPVRGDSESLRGLDGAFWVRITVVNPSSRPIDWYLQHQNGQAVGVEPTVMVDGEAIAGAIRPLQYRSPLFQLSTPPNTIQHILVRRSAPQRLVFRAAEWRAWSPAEFNAHARAEAAAHGAVYGIMFALAIYNLFLFLSLRIAAYGYYVVCALFFTLTWMSWEGLLGRGLPWLSPPPTLLEPSFLGCLGCIAATQFARLLLESRRRAPRMDRYLRFLLLPFSIGAIAAISVPWGPALATVLTLPLATVPIAAAIAWRRGFRPARFLALGSGLFAAGAAVLIVLQLSGTSVVGAPLRLVPSLQVIELLLMSFALADRMKLLQHEKEAVEQLHRASVERNQQELEAKVRERTVELEAARGRAETLARVDALTGVANRLALLEHGQSELARSLRHERPLSVVMIDIDHFKAINDSYGHAAGDVALKSFAAVLSDQLRESDKAGRIGGEEFAIILAETGPDAALAFAERVREGVAEAPIRIDEQLNIRLTASLGVASYESGDGNLDSLLQRADSALYEAKRAGRNRVAVAPAAEPPVSPRWPSEPEPV